MYGWNRRQFLITGTQALAAMKLAGMAQGKPKVALVRSTHPKLPRTAGPDQELDYEIVRSMVWKAIEYGAPRAGSLEAKIKPGSWVVLKPNIVFLGSQAGYRTGDITDMRVTKAVLEYVASRTKAARITIAEGGSYRSTTDPLTDNVVTQNGVRVDALTYDWGTTEWPGFGGTLAGMLKEFSEKYPGKRFDYVDLSYDVIKDPSGAPARIEVPKRNGVTSFSRVPNYFVTNAICKCDFLISIPVAKVHDQCGITACFKNYVGTAPRMAYCDTGRFWNVKLHGEHSVDFRIDPFIADLAAFHPPDYNVVDCIRGLQYTEHNNRRPDQMVRTNAVLAGEDTVSVDAAVARILGFRPEDIDFLHMGAARGLGSFNFRDFEVVGDELDRVCASWAKPRQWYARANRLWRIGRSAETPVAAWKPHTSFGDILYPDQALGERAPVYYAQAKIRAEGARKGYLWMGISGKAAVTLNGVKILEEESTTRFRVGQFQKEIELRPGENELRLQLEPLEDRLPQAAVVLVGPENNGDGLDGAVWTA